MFQQSAAQPQAAQLSGSAAFNEATGPRRVSLANVLTGQAELANRLIDVVMQTRDIADRLSGPQAEKDAPQPVRSDPGNMLEQADLTLCELHQLVTEVNIQVDRIRTAIA